MAATVPEIMDALEKSYDTYADARLAHGDAKADYERVRLGAVARSTEKSAAAKNAEADVLARYLPAAVSDDELAAIVAEEVAAAGDAGMKAMGAVVRAVRTRAASADGGKVAAMVKTALGGG